ncbi:MAG: RHS repeat-associated core domain-containing protein [Bacteroidales bacterium]|nr:RHS repeat-associated core domain-containing protein [Bacteroidales bacterium]
MNRSKVTYLVLFFALAAGTNVQGGHEIYSSRQSGQGIKGCVLNVALPPVQRYDASTQLLQYYDPGVGINVSPNSYPYYVIQNSTSFNAAVMTSGQTAVSSGNTVVQQGGGQVVTTTVPVSGQTTTTTFPASGQTLTATQVHEYGLPESLLAGPVDLTPANRFIDLDIIRNPSVNVYLHFDATEGTYYATPVSWTITYDIALKKTDGTSAPILKDQTLKVRYTPQGRYSDKAIQVYHGYTSGTVTVTDVKPEGTASVPDDLILELQAECDRWYRLEQSEVPVVYQGIIPDASKSCYAAADLVRNELPLSWDYVHGAESYDLEWLFIDIPEELPPTSTLTNYDYDMRNATRINTTGNHYNISLAYPRGILIYRVRARGVDIDKATLPYKEAGWSFQKTRGNLGEIPVLSRFSYCGLEDTLNWQYTATYAEEGKRKEVITFYDGILNKRQQATVSNTEQLALVGETVYDYQDRAAVQVMPGVVPSEGMKLYGNGKPGELFNGTYGAKNFDTRLTFNDPGKLDANNTSLSARYWSNGNPFLSDPGDAFSRYLPNGEGYSFTRTTWMNDGTGRVKSQSGAGPVLRTGNNHDTRYFYGRPAGQVELDRLFGSEVGFVSHYEKNVTIDPNKQATVAYVDQEKRTIATALTGPAPENLLPLDHAPQAVQLTANLLDNNVLMADNRMVSVTTWTVTSPSPYKFHYELDTARFCDKCLECSNCIYRLSITLKNNEKEDGSFEWAVIDKQMSQHEVIDFPASSPILLDPGSYTLTRTIRVDEASEEALASAYRNHDPPCIDAPVVKQAPCVFTCDSMCRMMYPLYDSAGIRKFSYWDDQGVRQVSQNMTSRKQMIDACIKKNCNPEETPYIDECALRRKLMLRDMSPGGQYFDNAYFKDTIRGVRNDPLINAWLNKRFPDYYKSPLFPDLILNNLYATWHNQHPDTVWNYMRKYWKAEWGEKLLPCHPEYCIYQYYCLWNVVDTACVSLQSPDYRDYDSVFQVCPDSLAALGGLFWNPLMLPMQGAAGGALSDNSNYQPFTVPPSTACNPTHQYYEGMDPFFLYNATWGYTGSPLPMIKWPYFDNSFNPIKRMALYLQHYIQASPTGESPVRYYSLWYVLFDPDDIAHKPASQAGLNQEVIDLFITLQDSVFKPVALGGQGVRRFDYFKGTYTFFKKKIISDVYDHLLKFTKEPPCAPCTIPVTPVGTTSTNATWSTTGGGNLTGTLSGVSKISTVANAIVQQTVNPVGIVAPPTCELKYDDGGQEDFFVWATPDNLYAVRFTPAKYPATILGCSINIGTVANYPTHIPNTALSLFEVLIFDDKGSGGSPGVILKGPFTVSVPLNTYGWIDRQYLFGSGLAIGSGSFYIVMKQVGKPPDAPGIAMDTDTNRYRSYSRFVPGNPWVPASGNLMIRAIITCPPGQAGDSIASDDCRGGFYLKSKTTSSGLLSDELFTVRYWHNTLFDLLDNPAKIDALVKSNLKSGCEINCKETATAWMQSLGKCINMNKDDSTDIANYLISICLTGCNPPYPQGTDTVPYGGSVGNFKCFEDVIKHYHDLCSACDTCPHIVYPPAKAADSVRNPFGNFADYKKLMEEECVKESDKAAREESAARLNTLYAAAIPGLKAAYRKRCYDRLPHIESFTMTYSMNEYCYTLYYYDRAGNLIKTVPPSGVDIIKKPDSLAAIARHRELYRNKPDTIFAADHYFAWPKHKMVSSYKFNSLEKPVEQHSPDGGQTIFRYDILGRLAISQNDEQKEKNTYSYTLYDPIGRTVEVGELANTNTPDKIVVRDSLKLKAFITGSPRSQVSHTFYDQALITIPRMKQHNLRNRVASIALYNTLPSDLKQFNSAIHYSYDIHGNVDTLTNDLPMLGPWNRRFITTTYLYDLVSGKVNQVTYQPGKAEQFMHRYKYDADNRITEVFTSMKGRFWDRDARYLYYRYGPLARIELGEKQVQGIDYAYTLLGWIKGVNSFVPSPDNEMGQDGNTQGKPNNSFARDAYSFALGYFDGDYKAVGPQLNWLEGVPTNNDFNLQSPDLFNSNIRYMSSALAIPAMGIYPQGWYPVNVYGYRYDQLNRLKQAKTFTTPQGGMTFNALDDYLMGLSYDYNGNIETLQRNGYEDATAGKVRGMDNLAYKYEEGTNKLNNVFDEPGLSANYTEDIDKQEEDNYKYDKTGNLVRDASEDISNIKWTVYGKMKTITRNTNRKLSDLEFIYDPTGNRVVKVDKTRNDQGNLQGEDSWNYTFYSRDVQGNIMANYLLKNQPPNKKYILATNELDIYGSSRLGVTDTIIKIDSISTAPDLAAVPGSGGGGLSPGGFSNGQLTSMTSTVIVSTGGTTLIIPIGICDSVRSGCKQYELTNHLGNVMATVSDRKIPVSSDNAVIDFHLADIRSSQDYYAFGMLIPGRNHQIDTCRFGFNGQEKEKEITGVDGVDYIYKYRVYDSRICRFLTMDPLASKFRYLTPYQFSSNSPIAMYELEGLEGALGCKAENAMYAPTSTLTGPTKRSSGTFLSMGSASAKVGVALTGALAITTGTAIDVIGITYFTLTIALHPGNQSIEDNTVNPQLNFGATIGVDATFIWSSLNTFETAIKDPNIMSGSFGIKWILGASVMVGTNSYGFSVGVGLGAMFSTGNQTSISQSISMVSSDADEWSKFRSGKINAGELTFDMEVGNITNTYDDQGNLTGATAQLGYNKDGGFISSGINVKSGVKTVNNKSELNNVWKSDNYAKEENKLNQ